MKMKKILTSITDVEQRKVTYVGYKPIGEAENWWTQVMQRSVQENQEMTWPVFKGAFSANCFPEDV